MRALFDALAAFTPAQQRQFVRFVTGCPRLPVGGLKALNPCAFSCDAFFGQLFLPELDFYLGIFSPK